VCGRIQARVPYSYGRRSGMQRHGSLRLKRLLAGHHDFGAAEEAHIRADRRVAARGTDIDGHYPAPPRGICLVPAEIPPSEAVQTRQPVTLGLDHRHGGPKTVNRVLSQLQLTDAIRVVPRGMAAKFKVGAGQGILGI
jgi:hypothetical protein